MANLLQRAFSTGWHKSLNGAAICEVVRSDRLIDMVNVCAVGGVEVRSIEWDEYWASDQVGLQPGLALKLKSLKSVRTGYIGSNFELSAASAYCQTYFELLRDLLSEAGAESALRALLALETFSVVRPNENRAVAAGVVTIRHPVYLLAKLRRTGSL